MMESNTGLQAGRAGEIANDIAASLALSDASQVKQESLVDMDLSEQLVQPAVTLHVTSAPVPVLNTVLTAGQTAALAVPVPEARPEESEVKPELNDVWMDNGISGQEHAEVIKVEPDVDGETTTTAVSQMAVEAGSSFNMAATPSLIADDTQQSSPNVLTPASSGGAATEIPDTTPDHPMKGLDPRLDGAALDIPDEAFAPSSSHASTSTVPSKTTGTSKVKNSTTATLSPHGFQPFTVPIDEKYVYLYFRFCAERHRMWVKRCAGVPRDQLTTDETMRKTFVGNIFRELDPMGEKHRKLIVGRGEQTNEEVCFRMFLFTSFYLEGTYTALEKGLGEVPNWKNFNLERYEAILHDYHVVGKNRIYYGGFQIVPPKSQFGVAMPSYSASLRMVISMMEMDLPARLAECRYAIDASELIRTIPTFGGFLSLCLLCFLQESPTLKFYYRNFATCGPGSRSYLRRIFGTAIQTGNQQQQISLEQSALMWLYENQWRYWARIGEDPPHAFELGLRPGMRVLDLENALCWCHRYANDLASHTDWSSLADIPLPDYPPEADEAQVPAWCDEERYADSESKPAYIGDYAEEAAKLQGFEQEGKEGEEWYEVEKIVGRSGKGEGKNGMVRVRWKGYPPEDDTWEREVSLRETSREALEEWHAWEAKVQGTINRIKTTRVYEGEYTAGPVITNQAPKPKTGVRAPLKTVRARAQRVKRSEVIEIVDSDDEIVSSRASRGPSSLPIMPERRSGRASKRPERLVDQITVHTRRTGHDIEVIPNPYTEDWKYEPPLKRSRVGLGQMVKKEEVDMDF